MKAELTPGLQGEGDVVNRYVTLPGLERREPEQRIDRLDRLRQAVLG